VCGERNNGIKAMATAACLNDVVIAAYGNDENIAKMKRQRKEISEKYDVA